MDLLDINGQKKNFSIRTPVEKKGQSTRNHILYKMKKASKVPSLKILGGVRKWFEVVDIGGLL